MSDSYQCIKKEIHMKKLVAVLTLVLALMLAMTAFASQDTITIGVANDITTLDPQASNTDANMMAFTLTHETLVQIDPETGDIVPGLADSWEVSEDGKTFTFHIPSGVTFTDGTPCTANDVAFTYTIAKDSSFANAKVSGQTVSSRNQCR